MAVAATGIGTALKAVGTGIQVLSALRSGQAANTQAQQRAELFRRQADRERQIGELNASEFARDERRRQARFRNLFIGASGAANTGTPIKVQSDLAAEAEFQRLKILSGAQADGSRFLTQASFSRFEGRQAKSAGRFRAGALLLKGAGQLFG